MLTTSRLRTLLKENSLASLQESFQHTLKKHPSDHEARRALASLWCIEEDWDKALLQADTLVKLEDAMSNQGELLKNLILSEMMRKKVLAGERKASQLEETSPAWLALLHQANQACFREEHEKADELRFQAFELAPVTSGQSEKLGAFEWIADGDGRLGPVCEFICAGGYRWVPFEHIRSLTVGAPQSLLDLLWIPATLDTGARKWNGYLPARYPGTAQSQSMKLGDETHWHQQSLMLTIGEGRKMWVTEQDEFSIMESGKLTFDVDESR
ncbi:MULTISPECIES: type VI secretion system accessory protein TagJ [Enterobacterales]|uniref:type VI secretion system accessory protein TagJ n=1 Tax=Enterobacterales TaxID=91347 RepID=UPI002ED92C06